MVVHRSSTERDGTREAIVLHASPEWSNTQTEASAEDVLPQMLNAFWKAIEIQPGNVRQATAHRWRFSIPRETIRERILVNQRGDLVSCGDWAGGPRVEGAFLSGMAAARRLLTALSPRQSTAVFDPKTPS